jgi:hypothetical protein
MRERIITHKYRLVRGKVKAEHRAKAYNPDFLCKGVNVAEAACYTAADLEPHEKEGEP